MVVHPNPEYDAEQLKKNEEFEAVHASDADVVWEQDPQSYLTIMPYYDKGKIMVRVYSVDHKKLYIIDGDKPNQIYYKVMRLGLITRLEHAAYLGKELQKAFVALQNRLYFNQDEELDFSKKVEPPK